MVAAITKETNDDKNNDFVLLQYSTGPFNSSTSTWIYGECGEMLRYKVSLPNHSD